MSQEIKISARERIAKNIQEYRMKQNIKREKLSLAIDVDNSYISKLEKCKVNITIDKIEALAEYFGIDIIDLLKR